MALNNFSVDLFVVVLNGRTISDWGETDPAYSDDELNPISVLRQGRGSGAVRLDNPTAGRRVTLNLNPGSPDSAFVQALVTSKATANIGVTQVGTLEGAVGAEGVFVSKGTKGRAGQTITDDQYIIEFNIWEETAGGA